MPTTASTATKADPQIQSEIEDATVICFSHLRWDFVYQRPQHILTRAAECHATFVIEEPIFEDVAAPEMRFSPRGAQIQVGVPVLPHGMSESGKIFAQRQLVETLLAGLPTRRRIFWYYTPMALLFSRHLDADLIVFDNMDQLSAFRGAPPELIALEDEMLAKADVVFTGGHSLYEAKKHRHRNIHAFPSSIDVAHFGRGRAGGRTDPEDQAHIPGPRLGFFGVIDERLDVDMVGRLADLRPDWSFVMVGPVVKIDPADLPLRANLHWLGARDYKTLPDYIGGWDVGIMPFALNESTRFISPTKTPEFLAAGAPVVSTRIVDVVSAYGDDGLVAIVDSAEEMALEAERLMTADRGDWLARVDATLAENSWDLTFARMYGLMADAHAGRSPRHDLDAKMKDAARV